MLSLAHHCWNFSNVVGGLSYSMLPVYEASVVVYRIYCRVGVWLYSAASFLYSICMVCFDFRLDRESDIGGTFSVLILYQATASELLLHVSRATGHSCRPQLSLFYCQHRLSATPASTGHSSIGSFDTASTAAFRASCNSSPAALVAASTHALRRRLSVRSLSAGRE